MKGRGWAYTLVDGAGPGCLDWGELGGEMLMKAGTGVDGRWRGTRGVEGEGYQLGWQWGEAVRLGGEAEGVGRPRLRMLGF